MSASGATATATSFQLDVQREAEERPDRDDDPQDAHAPERRRHGDGPDDVGGDEELEAEQEALPSAGVQAIWERTLIGVAFGEQERAVATIVR